MKPDDKPKTLVEEIEDFFATVSPEELDRLWKEADCDFYNKVGADIVPPPGYRSPTTPDPEDEIRS